eukprot:m.163318 g.163318  ORF g.163318 m.163318 type:complete len:319 (+) comp17110_c2_seq1:112-1068(+)
MEEVAILSKPARLLHWGEGNAGVQWKHCGSGTMQLLRNNDSGMVRLTVTLDNNNSNSSSSNVKANHLLGEGMKLERTFGCERSWVYRASRDADASASSVEAWALRFLAKEEADEFKVAFEAARDTNVSIQRRKAMEAAMAETAAKFAAEQAEGSSGAHIDAERSHFEQAPTLQTTINDGGADIVQQLPLHLQQQQEQQQQKQQQQQQGLEQERQQVQVQMQGLPSSVMRPWPQAQRGAPWPSCGQRAPPSSAPPAQQGRPGWPRVAWRQALRAGRTTAAQPGRRGGAGRCRGAEWSDRSCCAHSTRRRPWSLCRGPGS